MPPDYNALQCRKSVTAESPAPTIFRTNLIGAKPVHNRISQRAGVIAMTPTLSLRCMVARIAWAVAPAVAIGADSPRQSCALAVAKASSNVAAATLG